MCYMFREHKEEERWDGQTESCEMGIFIFKGLLSQKLLLLRGFPVL